MSRKITRKEALRRLAGFAMSPALISPLLAGAGSESRPAVARRSRRRQAPDHPNILWITLEGVPLSMLSCYGARLIQTPNIDKLASQGMLFRNSFCTNALCAPSRATLLSGKYSHKNGMLENPGGSVQNASFVFDPSQETVAKILRRNGYQTGTVGKWHLISNPAKCGFDYFAFKRGAGGPYYNPKGYLQNPSLGSDVIEQKSHEGYITDNFTDLAIKGMEQFKEPFLMMMQFFNDHRPFDPPHRYEHLYDNQRIPEPGTFWDDYATRSSAAKEAHMRIQDMMDFDPPADLTPRQRRQWSYQRYMEHFLGAMKALDENVGRLLDYLDTAGLSDRTYVILTGDHGFFMGEHGWFDKRFMYEESIRVPWIARFPGEIEAGTTRDEWVVNIDNAPTMLDLAGLPPSNEMQGESLKPILEGNPPGDWRTSLYYHYYEFGPPHWVLPNYGIRTDRYKLISYYTINEWEMFDLEKDPDEMENLFEDAGVRVRPDYEQVAGDLVQQLKNLREKYEDTTGKPVRLWPARSYN